MKRSIRISIFLFTFAALISLPLQAFAWVDMGDAPRIYHTKNAIAAYKHYWESHTTPSQVHQGDIGTNMGDSPRIYHSKRYAAAWKHYMATAQSSKTNSMQMTMATPSNPGQTVKAASRVFQEAAMNPAQAIPAYLIRNSAGIAIFPDRARVTPQGGTYRSGVMLSHRSNGTWSSPVFVSLASGTSQSKQVAQAKGVVLIFNNRSALNKAAKNDNFTLGVDATLAEGYTGSNTSAAKPHAAVLAYQSTAGRFSGVSLKGSQVNVETEPTITYYNLSEGQAGANGYYRSSGEGIYNKIIGSTDSAEMIERHPSSAAQLREAINDYVFSQGHHHSAM
jgi:SH3 domain-containing YSC84-like protein 1